MIRIRIIYGEGGKAIWSAGFILFANRLRDLGHDVHDDIEWDQPDAIIADIHKHRDHVENVLFGFSMGALCATWAASAGQPIALMVGYDPSGGTRFPPRRATPPNPIGRNVRRCLCYVHKFDPMFISAPFTGHGVEIVQTWSLHGMVQGNEWLHQITLKALAEID
jgi:hypothetical protein